MGSHRLLSLLAVACVCFLQLAEGQDDFYGWLESSTNNKPVAPTEPRRPDSCVWEDAPVNGYSFTSCPSGICSDVKGSYKHNGTIRFTWCKKNYALAQGSDRDTCLKGSWTSSGHKCTPCGRSSMTTTPQSLSLTSGMSTSGVFPWTATVYTWSLNPTNQVESWQLACSGILASPGSVLTAYSRSRSKEELLDIRKAGHCVGDVLTKNVRVGLNKMRSDIGDKELKTTAIISDVKEIVRPTQFDRQALPTDQDVVMLVLAQTVNTTSNIMPACLDWTGSMRPRNNEIGFVAGWDSSDQGLTPRWGYKKYVDNDTCVRQLRSRDRELVTPDKFCLEEAKGVTSGKGDGAGVTFVRDGAHCVYGVVSGKVETQKTDLKLITSLVNSLLSTVSGATSGKGDGAGVTFVRDGAHYVYGVVSGKVETQKTDLKLVTNLVAEGHRFWLQRNWRRLHRGSQLPPAPARPQADEGACSMDSDCRDDQGCIGKCVDLCPIACEDNSDCTMVKHQPICKCKPGYKGDPHTACIKDDTPVPPKKNHYELAPGDVCKQDGQNVWTCKFEGFCAKAADDLQSGRTPETCSTSEDGDVVVCCEPDDVIQPAAEETSKSKCRWFAQSVYSESSSSGGRLKDTCSIPKSQPKHGVFAPFGPGEFPHLGIIGDDDLNSWHYGNLISEQWFLSSGFCATSDSCTTKVRLGIYDNSNGDGKGLPDYDVLEKHIHPAYDEDAVYDSIGLYKLKTVVRFSQFIRPACLVSEHKFPGTKGVIIGTLDGTLKKTTSEILPTSQCNITNTNVRDPSMYCVNTYRSDDGIIMFSGFPMVVPLEEPYCMYGLLGMATYGANNGPEGYMRLSYYLPWIENLVWPS